MEIYEAIILAIVEGITEFLPISSTGHMILAQGIMGMESDEYLRAFTVMIQFGAILSVVVLYWRRFFTSKGAASLVGTKNLGESKKAPLLQTTCTLSKKSLLCPPIIRFYLLIILGCIPAGIFGFLFSDQIDKLLSNVYIVASMLLVGGIFMLFIDKIFASSKKPVVTPRKAFIVGLFQCIAMIPGVSRSMATIVGGLQQKLSRKIAAEFSFFLAVPTMFGATLWKSYQLYGEFGVEIFKENAVTLILGNLVAFIVALLAIRFFINFLTKRGFRAFGWYRIFVGIIILVLLFAGVPLTID